MPLTKDEIKQGLRDLGVEGGMVLMVHSSLSALGRVEGGADTVIDALIEVIGPSGTVMMPAMGGAPVFDVNETPSNVGTITDRFWRRPETIRSIHPTHSAAGVGPLAEQLLAGHVGQPTAIGPDSPWGRIARLDNGYLLFIGCDQDRNTLLHTAEDIVEGAYLQTIVRDYYDADRRKQTAVLERFPGPHRDFIQLDRLFAQAGAMRVGRIGSAVCRLMKASEILRLAVEALRADPAAVLCDNPHCMDCVKQRAAIKRARLAEEQFTLSSLLTDVFPPDEIGQALECEPHHGAADVVGVVVGDQDARQSHAVGFQGVHQFAGRIRGIDHHRVTGFAVTDQIREIAHLGGDHVAGGEVVPGEQLFEVEPVVSHAQMVSGARQHLVSGRRRLIETTRFFFGFTLTTVPARGLCPHTIQFVGFRICWAGPFALNALILMTPASTSDCSEDSAAASVPPLNGPGISHVPSADTGLASSAQAGAAMPIIKPTAMDVAPTAAVKRCRIDALLRAEKRRILDLCRTM